MTILKCQIGKLGANGGTILAAPFFRQEATRRTAAEKVRILIDEISWMDSKDHNFLGIKPEVVDDNRFFQGKNTHQQGCQIDYMIQTHFNTLYICEIKFYRNPITASEGIKI